MNDQQSSDPARRAIEITKLALQEIDRLERQCAYWHRLCKFLTAMLELAGRKFHQLERAERTERCRHSHRRKRQGRRGNHTWWN